MVTIILLTFLSMTILFMGFLGIKLPFITHDPQPSQGNRSQQQVSARFQSENHAQQGTRGINQQNSPYKPSKSSSYPHYTTPTNRGIFSSPSLNTTSTELVEV